MENTFLILSIVGFAFTVNALRPFPGTILLLPSFFGGWLTAELAPQLLLAHVCAISWMVAGGAVEGRAGWSALGLSALTAAGLCVLIGEALRARGAVDEALTGALGRDYLRDIRLPRPVEPYRRIRYRQLVNPLWFRHRDVRRTRGIPYLDGARRRNLLDVYAPKHGASGAPILVYVHGGGWAVSNKNQQGKPLMLHLASRGWVCVAPNYRLSPRAIFPDHLVDLKRAIAWIRGNAARFGADPSFVAVAGGSAGAHLAALVALTAGDPEYQPGFEHADTSIQAAVPIYGVYDLTNGERLPAVRQRMKIMEWFVLKRRFADHRDEFEKASPHYRVRPDAPPFLVIHGEHDLLASVAEARTFVEKLRPVSRRPVAYAELPGAQHAFDVFPSIRTAFVVQGIERFLNWTFTRWRDAGQGAGVKATGSDVRPRTNDDDV